MRRKILFFLWWMIFAAGMLVIANEFLKVEFTATTNGVILGLSFPITSSTNCLIT